MSLIPLAIVAIFLLIFAPKTKIEGSNDRAEKMKKRYKSKPQND